MNGQGSERERAERLLKVASRVSNAGLDRLDDRHLLDLLDEHRWAVARLASRRTPLSVRSILNAAVLRTHGLLNPVSRRATPPLGVALWRLRRSLPGSAGVFLGSALLAFSAVVAEPILAFSLVPRALLQQIDATHWGDRGSVAADVGMTLFYWSNNLRASFLALGLGVLGGVPAMLVVGFNGALLGAVGGAAAMRGAGPRLLGWIAPHGVPELAGVILCGAIGWELGRSWIEPGWRGRRAALADAGRELTPMVVVAALLIICAAPLEGFVAPLDLPLWLDLAVPGAWLALLATGAALALRSVRR